MPEKSVSVRLSDVLWSKAKQAVEKRKTETGISYSLNDLMIEGIRNQVDLILFVGTAPTTAGQPTPKKTIEQLQQMIGGVSVGVPRKSWGGQLHELVAGGEEGDANEILKDLAGRDKFPSAFVPWFRDLKTRVKFAHWLDENCPLSE